MTAEDADLLNHGHVSPLPSADVVRSWDTLGTSSPEAASLLAAETPCDQPADDITAAVVRFLTSELPEVLSIAGTVHADMLEAIAAVLAEAHVFDDLSERDARRVAGALAFEAIHTAGG